jgi:LPS-assembly lipoprotein
LSSALSSRLAAALLCAVLAGCGFQLRGDAPMGLATMHVSSAVPSTVANEVRRSLASSSTKLVPAPQGAQAHLRILAENIEKTIFTLTGTGRVYEFQLRLLVSYQVDVPGTEIPLVPASEIDVRRVITYSETAPIAKEAEELLLYKDMQADAAGQILRRIAVVQRGL